MKSNHKAALVTGGAKRLGKAICLALAEKGYHIALHYGQSEQEAEETAGLIQRQSVKCTLFKCDLSDMTAVEKLVSRVFQEFPGCSLLINSASVFKRGSFQNTDLAFLEKHLTVNFMAPFLLSQKFAQSCSSGLIVNMLDTKISKHSKHFFAYTLSKKLLHEFTKMAASTLGPAIRVNGICPGIILPSTETSQEALEKMIRKLPVKRKGSPENIIRAVIYLIENEFVTGDCLYVDGGEHL
ncbi:SDR family oxidoreductase [bacterium]|nr:SDR family oxidoreductase [bacterium]